MLGLSSFHVHVSNYNDKCLTKSLQGLQIGPLHIWFHSLQITTVIQLMTCCFIFDLKKLKEVSNKIKIMYKKCISNTKYK